MSQTPLSVEPLPAPYVREPRTYSHETWYLTRIDDLAWELERAARLLNEACRTGRLDTLDMVDFIRTYGDPVVRSDLIRRLAAEGWAPSCLTP